MLNDNEFKEERALVKTLQAFQSQTESSICVAALSEALQCLDYYVGMDERKAVFDEMRGGG